MNNANYILKTNEAVLMPTEVNKGKNIMKVCVWVIISIIVLASLIFQENLFDELSWSIKMFLIVLVVGFGFYGGKKEYTASPMELQFYSFWCPLQTSTNQFSKDFMALLIGM